MIFQRNLALHVALSTVTPGLWEITPDYTWGDKLNKVNAQ